MYNNMNLEIVPKELGLVISSDRQERGWSQETLAQLAKISPRSLQRMESGNGARMQTKRCLAIVFEIEDLRVFI
ncbi:helix-turn-helix domain-containing protein [Legionella brunensis]|uniref:Helix-turn-helix protein n=1 Tax=Legionella brunensis TaxID=29422 RepID=A0A0W0SSJ5_9GAMM|nr:helix-turn-helix domain-containing protein [Legionella brunensis]KTC86386.1 helix-turn-helix protein [Legionella brunensis]